MREYLPKNRGIQRPRGEFALTVLRNGVEERHVFEYVAQAEYTDVLGIIRNDGSPHVVPLVDRFIRRALVDDDGTPARWAPNIVRGHFTAPNGDHTPEERLAEFTVHGAGSSRRRWNQLMDGDDEVTVEQEQIMAIMRDLIEEASEKRPTEPSSASSPS